MELRLFHKWNCPYSAKVRDYIEHSGLRNEVEYVNIMEGDNEDELKKLTGKTQVPCLMIGEQPLFGSEEIVSWLRSNLLTPGQQSASL